MKKALLSLSVLGLCVAGTLSASAYYYTPSYQQNYVVSTYVPQYLSNCYYTASYPPTYYGTCVGTGANYGYSYGNYGYSYPYNYTNYSYTVPNGYRVGQSQYSTYGYYNGSWYPGYQPTSIFNSYSGNNCYYQNGYQMCY